MYHMGGPGPDDSCGGLGLERWEVWFRGCLVDGCAGMGRHQVERLGSWWLSGE